MKIVVFGGTGSLGGLITNALLSRGDDVVIVTRTPAKHQKQQGYGRGKVRYIALEHAFDDSHECVSDADVILNLSGANVGAHRWTARWRALIRSSRVDGTKQLVEFVNQQSIPPALINASGAGYYGNSLIPGGEFMGAGQSFLARVVSDWEDTAMQSNGRVVLMRMGVALTSFQDGFLKRVSLPFRFFVGGSIGSGKQYLPWIHWADLVAAWLYVIDNPTAHGPYNVVAPQVLSNKQFMRILGTVLRRPAFLRLPSALIRLLLGRQADIVLHGQALLPIRLRVEGFKWKFSELNDALENCRSNPPVDFVT